VRTGLFQDQTELSQAVRRFAEGELAEDAHARAQRPDYTWDIAEKLVGMGMLGITLREADGGIGGTLMDAVITIQELAMVCPKSADVVRAGNFGPIRTFAEFGTPSQKERWQSKGVVTVDALMRIRA
jgi:hypothetical protein